VKIVDVEGSTIDDQEAPTCRSSWLLGCECASAVSRALHRSIGRVRQMPSWGLEVKRCFSGFAQDPELDGNKNETSQCDTSYYDLAAPLLWAFGCRRKLHQSCSFSSPLAARFRRGLQTALLMLVFCGACRRSNIVPQPDAASADVGAQSASATQVIGPEGGSVQLDDVTLTFPKATFATPQSISIARTDQDPPEGYGASSRIYRFSPEGLTFQRPVVIQFANQSTPQRAIYWTDSSDQGQFKRRQTTTNGAIVSASIRHFSRAFVGRGVGIVNKMDILFAIDNSTSMDDKQQLLAEAMPELLARLLRPRCVGEDAKPVGGVVDDLGNCARGQPEFPRTLDLHIGVISSSLGARGSDLCVEASANDEGHLLNRTPGARANLYGPAIPNASPGNFIAWPPRVDKNSRQHGTARSQFEKDFRELISGVKQLGCGYEAQLERVYRFRRSLPGSRPVRAHRRRPMATAHGRSEKLLQHERGSVQGEPYRRRLAAHLGQGSAAV